MTKNEIIKAINLPLWKQDFIRKNNLSIEKLADEIANYPWSWDVWYKTTLTDTLKEIDKLSGS